MFWPPQSMYFLYSLVLFLLFVALLPYFVYQTVRHGKYLKSFGERMGGLPESMIGDGRTVWVHAVSVGEFLAAIPLIKRLRAELPNTRIVVSTTTLTGQQLAQSQSSLFDAAFYFPFDWKFSVRRSLARVDPSVVIILETELWPNFLRECKRRGVLTVLANGRISLRSFRRYRLVGRPFRRAVEDFSLMIMQSEADAERARALGAPHSRVRVFGNLKYDASASAAGGDREEDGSSQQGPRSRASIAHPEIDDEFGLSRSSHLIVAGSTAPGEEQMLIESFGDVRRFRGLERTRLVLAPRHPERFDEVALLVARSGFTFARRSESRGSRSSVRELAHSDGKPRVESRSDVVEAKDSVDIILLDTIGELAAVYQFASVVFVGGSLVPRGGHNILEPAAFAKAILVGPHTENFRQMISDFVDSNAVVQISGRDVLTRELIELLSRPESARAIGARALDLLIKNRGATDRTVAAIKEVMGKRLLTTDY